MLLTDCHAPGVHVGKGVGVGVAPGSQLYSQLPALTTTFPQSPLAKARSPTYPVTPTVVCPPVTSRNATKELPLFIWATSVDPSGGATIPESLLSLVTPAISGCAALSC